MEFALDRAVGSTEYDVVEYSYERVTVDRYQVDYFSRSDGSIGVFKGWIPGNPQKGDPIDRKVISTVRIRNLRGKPTYVP